MFVGFHYCARSMSLIFVPDLGALLPGDESRKFELRWLMVWGRLERIESAAVKDSAAIFLVELVRRRRAAPDFKPTAVPLVFTFGAGWPEISVAATGHVSIQQQSDAAAEPVTWQPST